ncbi:MAG: UbiA family prenyltransferase [Candidatus Scalinduaceae bacterium]
MNILPYLKVMRIDHYHKNVFVIVGIVVFFKVADAKIDIPLLFKLFGAILIACIASSFNYIINELLDSDSDKFHPKKKHRPVPSGDTNIYVVLTISVCILLVTLCLSFFYYSMYFFITLILFFLLAILYNVPPLRFKDVVYMDVVIESANAPIRILLGWYAIGTNMLPKLSVLVSVWCLGGFLMTAKRYAEHKFISNDSDRGMYRRSYNTYTSEILSTYMVFWLILFNFAFGIFIVRIEPATLVVSPFLITFFIWYWWLSTKPDSIVKEPERVFEEKGFFVYSVFLSILFGVVFLFGSEIPLIDYIHHRYLFPK